MKNIINNKAVLSAEWVKSDTVVIAYEDGKEGNHEPSHV